jgi:hypothetical protein
MRGLQFRSKKINGDFIKGFCIRILRGKASLQIVKLKKNHQPIIFVLQPLTINNTSHSLTKYRIIYLSLPHKGHSSYYISTLKKQIIHHQKSPISTAIRCLSAQKMVYYMKCLQMDGDYTIVQHKCQSFLILLQIYLCLCIYLGHLIILIRLFKCVSWEINMYFIKHFI